MELTKRQINWLNKCTKGTWSLNPETGLVDVDGGFNCSGKQGLKNFKGVRFGVVTGYFLCCHNSLTTLEGAPQRVGGNFDCSNNSLTTLEGAPQEVGDNFNCSKNSLTTLEGAPQEIVGYFNCSSNSLTTLEGAPRKVGWDFRCVNNSLTSLEGAPREVLWTLCCGGNPIPAKILKRIWNIMKDKEVPYLIALGIYRKEVGDIDPRLTECIPEETIKGASLLARSLS